ncbi:MAG: BON domain-containing protein [Pirellulales bacterium]
MIFAPSNIERSPPEPGRPAADSAGRGCVGLWSVANVRRFLVVAIGLAGVVGQLAVEDAAAQLFGKRPLGRTLSRRVGADIDGEGSGTLTGRERFIRGNRPRTDFVGTDTRDERPYVGEVQGRAQGTVRSGLTGFRFDEGPDVNRSAPRATSPRIPLYPPRLQLGFNPPRRNRLSREATRQLEESSALASLGRIEVSMEGETAILRGEVASGYDAELAELLVRFEPGISDVRNELTIAERRSANPESMPAPPGP